MRIVSYNILNGGEGRADPLAEVIEANRPDVLVLIEADHPDVIDRIAKRLKMDSIFAQGRRHGAAILSRWKIVESINHGLLRENLSDCLLQATLHDPAGIEWVVAAAHLHAHATNADEEVRLREVDVILNVLQKYRDARTPHLLAGDFNANSPIAEINPVDCKPSTRKEWKENGGAIPRKAVQKLLDAGYVDSLAVVKGSQAGKIGTFSTQYPGQRVDYIFAHCIDAKRITAAGVEQDRLAKYASDHFPVFAEIQ